MSRPKISELMNNSNDMSRQAIIDGNFQIAQVNPTVGSEITTGIGYFGYPVFDMWKIYHGCPSGTPPTIKHSQQLITSGSVPGSKYCYRWAVDGAGTDDTSNWAQWSSYFYKQESSTDYVSLRVNRASGTATDCSFYMKAGYNLCLDAEL